MTIQESLEALALAGLALYGIGIPVAWLLPAPPAAQWVYRIAIAPVFSILVGYLAAQFLAIVNVPLHPVNLAGVIVAAWVVAAWFRAPRWRPVGAWRCFLGPWSLIVASGAVWALSLVGYGLYLPNRDFKNHAYFVAMAAWQRTGDPDLILRAAPVDPPSASSAYPVALHTLLGWVAPSEAYNVVGLTAAAAIVCTSVSLPLSFVALARMWQPMPGGLDWFAGTAAVCMSGLTVHFVYGSIVILIGTSVYAAGLTAVWLHEEVRARATGFALIAAISGLFVFHIAEAVGLVLVAGACLTTRAWPGRWAFRRPSNSALIGLGLGTSILAGFLATTWRRWEALVDAVPTLLTDDRIESLPAVLVGPAFYAVGRPYVMAVLVLVLVGLGVVVAISSPISRFPLVALSVPWILFALATWRGVPDALRLLSAPWYGEGPRIAMMAGPPMVLIAGLSLSRLARVREGLPVWRSGMTLAALTAVIVLTAGLAELIPQRRGDLESTLAGAGDTNRMAEQIARALEPGETVLTFEPDGTANLFAFARVPVLAAWGYSTLPLTAGMQVPELRDSLMRLDDPRVESAMRSLNVGFVAIGTTSLYWGQSSGYSMGALLEQQELSVYLSGTDMTILRYRP